MKNLILIGFIFLSISSYGQKFEYSIGGGANYSGINSFENAKYGTQLTSEVNFNINKRFSISSGIGFIQLKTEIHYNRTAGMTYFSGTNLETTYNDRQPFIIPNSVIAVYNEDSTEVQYVENTEPVFINESIYNSNPKSYYYNMVILNIPVIANFKVFNEKFRFRAGITTSFPVYAKVKEETEYTVYFGDTPYNYILTENYSSLNSFNFLHLNLYGGIRYHMFKHLILGVSFENSITNLTETGGGYIKSLSLNISYKF